MLFSYLLEKKSVILIRKIQQFSANHITSTVRNIYKYSKIIRNDSSTKEQINICNSQVFKTIVKTLPFILLRQRFIFQKSIYFMVISVFAMRSSFYLFLKVIRLFFQQSLVNCFTKSLIETKRPNLEYYTFFSPLIEYCSRIQFS